MRRLFGVGSLVAALVLLGPAAPALAQDSGYPPTSVSPTSAVPRQPDRALAFTGSDTLTLLLVGLAVIAAGLVLFVATRRRAAAKATLR